MGPSAAFTLGVVLQWAALSSLASGSVQENACRRGGGVDSVLLTQDQTGARELQHDISCSNDDEARALFLENVLLQYHHGGKLRKQLAPISCSVVISELADSANNVFPADASPYYAHKATFKNTLEACRASSCGEDSDVTWCISVYHPSEDIQICMDGNGIINQTEYSRRLQLQCYFSVPRPEVVSYRQSQTC